jgi:hypothetical protein
MWLVLSVQESITSMNSEIIEPDDSVSVKVSPSAVSSERFFKRYNYTCYTFTIPHRTEKLISESEKICPLVNHIYE